MVARSPHSFVRKVGCRAAAVHVVFAKSKNSARALCSPTVSVPAPDKGTVATDILRYLPWGIPHLWCLGALLQRVVAHTQMSVKALWLCLEIPGAGWVPSSGVTCGTPRALVVVALVFHTLACPWLGQGLAAPMQWFSQSQSRIFCQGSNMTVLSTLFYRAGLPVVTQHNFQGWK